MKYWLFRMFAVLVGVVCVIILLEGVLWLSGATYLFIQEWHNKQRINQQGICKVLCIGESTTAGNIDGTSYPSQLEKELNQQSAIHFKVINKGISGATTTKIRESFEAWLGKYRLDIVVAMLGVNDGRRDIVQNEYDDSLWEKLLKHSKCYKLMMLLRLHATSEASTINGNFDKSREEILRQRVRSCPEDIAALVDLGNYCFFQNGNQEAVELFEKVLRLQPNHYVALNRLAETLKQKSEDEKAEEIL
jgi:lysophospholipase L1-like esterase